MASAVSMIWSCVCLHSVTRLVLCLAWPHPLPSFIPLGAGVACWLERRTRDRKVASSNPGRSGGRILFSGQLCVLTLFGVRSTPVLPQWHAYKDPGHSAKSAGGRLHLNTFAPLTQRNRSGLTKPPSGRSVGTY